MVKFDFAIPYDPATDTQLDVFKRILLSTIIKRIAAKKPTVCFIGGDSGEGKSTTALTLQYLICDLLNINMKDYVNVMNVYTPLQYPDKIQELLFKPDYKKINIICMHEAREIVKAKNWNSFLNTAVADVNAMSRSVKPLIIMIVSQFIRDISKEIRYTLNHYMTVKRDYGRPARLYWQVIYKDDRDIETPILRKRKLKGYLILPSGKYMLYSPDYFSVAMPPSDIMEIFNKSDLESKSEIIKQKLNKLISEMKMEHENMNFKVDAMVEHYSANLDQLAGIGERNQRGRYKIKKLVQKMHDLTPHEFKRFEQELNAKLKKNKVFGDELNDPLEET